MDTPVAAMIRSRRDEVDLTQVELANVTGLSRGTIRNAEDGKPLEEETLRRILLALGCTHDGRGSFRRILSANSVKAITATITDAISNSEPSYIVKDLRESYLLLVSRIGEGSSFFTEAEQSQIADLLVRLSLVNLQDVFDDIRAHRADLHLPGIAELSKMLEHSLAIADGNPPTDQSVDEHQLFIDRVAASIGDSDITVRWLGDDINLGLVQLKVSVPVSSSNLQWLAQEHLRVIVDTAEMTVIQMVKSLGHMRSLQESRKPTKSQADQRFEEFQERARMDWWRQVRLVWSLYERSMPPEEIAQVLGENTEVVERMIHEAQGENGPSAEPVDKGWISLGRDRGGTAG